MVSYDVKKFEWFKKHFPHANENSLKAGLYWRKLHPDVKRPPTMDEIYAIQNQYFNDKPFSERVLDGVKNAAEGLASIPMDVIKTVGDYYNDPNKTGYNAVVGSLSSPGRMALNLSKRLLPYMPWYSDKEKGHILDAWPTDKEARSTYGLPENSTPEERLATMGLLGGIGGAGAKVADSFIDGLVGEGAANTAARTAGQSAYWTGAGTAQGQDPISALTSSLLIDGLGGAQTLAKRQDPVITATKEADKLSQQRTQLPGVRTPEQAKAILDNIDNMPTSLGELSGSQKVKASENIIRFLPFANSDNLRFGISHANDYSKSALNDLMKNMDPNNVEGSIRQKMNQVHQSKLDELNQLYEPINNALDKAGVKIKRMPNYNDTLSNILAGKSTDDEAAYPFSRPSFTDSQINSLKSFGDTSPSIKATGERVYNKTPRQLRDANIKLKKLARDYKGDDLSVPRAYNSLASSLIDDIEHNAMHDKSLPDDVATNLKNANQYAKDNYYNVWAKPDVQNYLNGKSSTKGVSLATNPKHAELVSQLPQELKNNLFASSLSSILSNNGADIAVNPALFMRKLDKLSPSNQAARNLLEPSMLKRLDTLRNMNDLLHGVKVDEAKVPTGKLWVDMIRHLGNSHVAGVLAATALFPKLIPEMLGGGTAGHFLGNYLENPETLRRYTEGEGRLPVKHNAESFIKSYMKEASNINE